MTATTMIYAASPSPAVNAARALAYWRLHPALRLFAATGGAYAVATDDDVWRYTRAGWEPVSASDVAEACAEMQRLQPDTQETRNAS